MRKYKIILVDEHGDEHEIREHEKIENLTIVAKEICEDNLIKIYKPAKFIKGCLLDLRGKGAKIILQSTKYAYNFQLLTATGAINQKLCVGRDCSMWTNVHFNLTDDNAAIVIGDDCMISKNVDIWAGDGHALIDTVTGKVINAGGGQITIGHHVWIGANVILTKNAKVADNSVIGTGGVVTKSFTESNIVLAGNPAVCIRKNIQWSRNRPLQYDIKNNKGSLT